MIRNPIIPGFNPDPSICRAGDDYYIATSTFEWYPGIMIYHSKDLINWELVARPLDNISEIKLYGNPDSSGIWAPHLTYDGNKFFLAITDVKNVHFFKDTLNYIMTCDTIDGKWSKPVFINASGFDPAIFHDVNGKKYFLNMLWDYRPEKPNFNGILCQEINPDTYELIGERKKIYDNETWHVIEGSQVFIRNGYYYLVCAEGGTGYNHSTTILRAKSIYGPYEKSPYWPLLTARHNPESYLQKAGHAGFVEYDEDQWYMAFLCSRPLTELGNCQMGRETSLARIKWDDNNWPYLAHGSHLPPTEIKRPIGTEGIIQQLRNSSYTDFNEDEIPMYLQSLRGPLQNFSLTERKGYLRLYGRQSPRSLFEQSLIARRWQSRKFLAETLLEFRPDSFQQMAGLICYYNSENWMYLFVTYNEDLKSRVLSLITTSIGKYTSSEKYIIVPESIDQIKLKVEVINEEMQFFYDFGENTSKRFGSPIDASVLSDDYIEKKGLVFTGAMVGICAQDMDRQDSYADFDYFNYIEK